MKLFNKIAVAGIGLAMAMGVGLTAVEKETVKTSAANTIDATLSFANKAQRTSFSTTQQVWEQNGIKFTNDKASSSNNVADYAAPVRLYANSQITVEAPGNISKIVFVAGSSAYATTLQGSIGSADVAGSNVTVNLNAADSTSFVVTKLSAQVRLNSLTCTYLEGGSSDPVAVESVELNTNEVSIYESKSTQLQATIAPIDATDKTVSWSTSDPTVATVENGLVKGLKAGTATITVTTTDGGKTDTCEVTVNSIKDDSYDYNDVITPSGLALTGTSYTDWSGKSASNTEKSSAVYAGHSYPKADYIQFRTEKDDAPAPSGIVSTTSGGLVKKVLVLFDASAVVSRSIDVYASNEPFTVADMFSGDMTRVANIANVDCAGSAVIDGIYQYVGIRSNDGAIYLNAVVISWDVAFTAEDEAVALTFAQGFKGALATICAVEDADNSAALSAVWADWKADFEALTSGAKIVFNTSDDATIAGARSLYAHVVGRYGLATWEGATPVASAAPFGAIMNNNANIMLIAVIALVSIAGVALILKKKASAK